MSFLKKLIKKKQDDKQQLKGQPLFTIRGTGTEFDVPVDGSLGLLALGYVGLMAWRQKRVEVVQQMIKEGKLAPPPAPENVIEKRPQPTEGSDG